jgi:hypothetical protein
MSSASRHFSRCRTSSGIPARARLARTARARAGSLTVDSSHDAGQNSRQFPAIDAVSVTIWTLTPIWQLPVLPSVPEYCRATHGEAVPSFGNPESSTTYASGSIASAAHRPTLARTTS